MTQRLLFGVSSVGLGHVRRSVTIANSLRRLGSFNVDWVSSEPSLSFLKDCGEMAIPVSSELSSLSRTMEDQMNEGRLRDMSLVARKSSAIARKNYSILKEYLSEYDVLVQDEFAETMFCNMWDEKPNLPSKRVVVTDYFRFKTYSYNPFDRIVIWYANRMLAKAYEESSLRIFVDDLDSIPDKYQDLARRSFQIVGPIVGEVPRESRKNLKERLFPNLNHEMILVVTVGGTAAGKSLLDFVVSNSSKITKALDMTIVILLGPRIERSVYPSNSDNLKFIPFTPDAPKFFKAADCVVAQAGASTMNEVASMGTACVSMPIANHWEQQANARRFKQKFGFEVLEHRDITTDNFVGAVNKSMSSVYEPANFSDAAERSAKLIVSLLEKRD